MRDSAGILRFPLNRSEYGLYMNELAFPGRAINTIGFMLRFPALSRIDVCSAADQVIRALPIFRERLVTEEDQPFLEWSPEPPDLCLLSDVPLTVQESSEIWEQVSQEPIPDQQYEWTVSPLAEGGAVLMARMHHALLDGYDMCRLVQLILDAIGGKKPQTIPVSHAEDTQIEPAKERRFWLNAFYDASYEPAVMHETTDGIRRDRLRIPLDEAFSERVREFAAMHDVHPSSVFAAALSLYLSRATDKPDAVFLMPRLGRDTQEEHERFGCHTQTIPVRFTIDESMSFPALCGYVFRHGRELAAHKDYGIGKILADLRNSGLTGSVVSEYAFNYYNTQLPSEIPYEIDMSMDGAMHNHLTLNITSFQGTFEIIYDMRCGVYDEARTRRFHEAIMAIMNGGMDCPERSVGELECLGSAEIALLAQQKGRQIALDENATIPSLFRDAVRRYADRPALYAGDVTYTFAALDAVSNRIANALLARGVQQGQTVIYKLRRDEKPVPVMLGILKAGCAFIPVDPAYPQGRIEYIRRDSGACMMIVSDPSAESDAVREEIVLLSAQELMAFPDASDPMLTIPPEQLAYCIYTSGTTGKPKGAMLSHKGIVNITHPDNNPVNRDLVKCGTGICAIGSVSFDISLFEFFVPMFCGMFIEFAPEEAMTDPAALAELIERHGANMLHSTPSRLTAYLNDEHFVQALRGVRVVLAAGERVPRSLVDELRTRFGIRIYNGYGPTETTIGATITEAGDNSSIGRPIGNTGIMILDSKGRRMPFGAVGEICIYGAGLGLGYRNLPEETAQHFVVRYGIPMYRTGDLGRFREDGRIIYHGRNDFQVKLRGLRIELAEIENCIRSCEGVSDVCVQVRKIGMTDHIAAFYSVRTGTFVDAEKLKEHTAQHLAPYMVPDVFMQLDAIPQTSGGKTDFRAIEAIPLEIGRVYHAPENPVQAAICRAFAKTLEIGQVGITDSFYDLGGDSLHTAEVVHNIEKELPGTEIGYQDIFRYPTPELLAQHLYLRHAVEAHKQENPLSLLDYTGIDELLQHNQFTGKPKQHRLGNVLLTGATGFLGVHVLAALLRRRDLWDHLYCIVRRSKRHDPEQRLKTTLFYFEETDCSDLYGKSLFAYDGDLTLPELFIDPFDGKVDTVINCAANVKHFAFGDAIDRVNIDGVRNLLNFCQEQGAAMVQISTVSIGGVYPAEHEELTLTARDLFVGQEIPNQYTRSKFIAEHLLLRAAVDAQVPVKIMRVGNLQGRISDGEFQVNRQKNTFTRQIASYVKMGLVPDSIYSGSVNFTPVDDAARMIVELCTLPEAYTVFQVYPMKEVSYQQIFRNIRELGYEIKNVSDEEFQQRVKHIAETEEGRTILEGLYADRPDLRYRWTRIDASFAEQMLHAMGIAWNEISDSYLMRCFRALKEFGTFDL